MYFVDEDCCTRNPVCHLQTCHSLIQPLSVPLDRKIGDYNQTVLLSDRSGHFKFPDYALEHQLKMRGEK